MRADEDHDEFTGDEMDAAPQSEADRIANSVLTSLSVEVEGSPVNSGADAEAGQIGPEIVDKDIFYTTLFRPTFTAMSLATRIPEAKISQDEEPAAREASDDLYDLLEVWYPAALNPQTGTFKKLCTVGGFLFYKLQVIRAAIADRRRAAMRPPEPQQAEPEFRSSRSPDAAPELDDWGGGAVPS